MQLDDYEATLSSIRSERGYTYSDIITVSPETLPNYEQKVAFLDNLIYSCLNLPGLLTVFCCLLLLYVYASIHTFRLNLSLRSIFMQMRRFGSFWRVVATLMCGTSRTGGLGWKWRLGI